MITRVFPGLLLAVSCAAPQAGSMKQRLTKLELQAPATTARVIFVRLPNPLGSTVTPFLIERGTMRVLGESLNGSAFSVDLAPGSYALCAAMPVYWRTGWLYPWEFDFSRLLHTPLTRLEVIAGRTYLLEVRVNGAVVEAVPARYGSLRARRLEAALPELSALEPIAGAPQLQAEPQDLVSWFEQCVDSTSPDRWKAGPDDGR